MYEESLSKAGLTPDQALVYEAILKKGALPAGQISKLAGLKRGLTYKILGELEASGLVHKKEVPNKVAVFEPGHPLRLKELAEQRETEAKIAQTALESVLGNLTSDFNLISGKPGVLVYEGKDAVAQIAKDSLTAEGVIYSYIDNDALDRYIPKENADYVRERVRRGIAKKIISPDTPHTLSLAKDFPAALLECRVIKAREPFATVMQIYGNKVSYLTLDAKIKVGVIIENAFIARMHRILFEQLWEHAKPIGAQLTPPASAGAA